MKIPRSLFLITGAIVMVIIAGFFGLFELIWANPFYKGMATSLMAAVLLAFLIFISLRPRVVIAPKIAKRKDKEDKTFYSFKFINTSIFAAFDVHIEAYVCYEINAVDNGRGVNVTTKKVKLRRSNWIYLRRWDFVTKNTFYAPHCVIISTDKNDVANDSFVKDIQNEINSNANYLEFRVTLKHSFSNLSSTYRQRYSTVKCIKEGEFEFGNSLEIN